ncbi:hypothetical protein BGZ65_006839, partial [Modicella reniformis]
VDVVAALLKAGADMTLASPMTHKTPLDLAESRLSYLLARAQESMKRPPSSSGFCTYTTSSSSGDLDFHDNQIATRSSLSNFHHAASSTTSPALLYQIRGIVNLLRPYVARQQKLQHGDRHKDRQNKERSWERADRYMRQQDQQLGLEGISSSSSSSGGGVGPWRSDPHSEAHFGDMEDEAEDDDNDDEEDQMDTSERRRRPVRKKRIPLMDMEGDIDLHDDEDEVGSKGLQHHQAYSGVKSKRSTRRLVRRMDADETGEALENLMNGLSLLEANRKQLEQQQHHQQQQQQQQQQPPLENGNVSDSADGNLADNELDPRSEQEVDEALPDLLEQVQQVLEAIKLNESQS